MPDDKQQISPKEVKLPARQTAIAVVDVQNDFHSQGGALYVGAMADEATPSLQALLHKGSAAGVPIIFTKNVREEDDAEWPTFWSELWPRHVMRGTWGEQVIEELAQFLHGPDVYVDRSGTAPLKEPKWGMDSTLRRLGVKNLVICGTCTNICVLHTADGIIPADCCASFGPYDQEIGIHQMMLCYNAAVTSARLLEFT